MDSEASLEGAALFEAALWFCVALMAGSAFVVWRYSPTYARENVPFAVVGMIVLALCVVVLVLLWAA